MVIPVFYVASLILLFFLVFFVSTMELDRRKHEFAVYLTLGMKRKKLFTMLMLEDFRNNIIALVIGLTIAILISEFTSLLTAKLIGLGILGHSFSFSLPALLFTVLGFLLVKTLANLLLSYKIAHKEIGELLSYSPKGMKKKYPRTLYWLAFFLGIILLSRAYYLAVSARAWDTILDLSITLMLGTLATLLLFFSFRYFLAKLAEMKSKKVLHSFNFRQLEELVIHKSSLLALCSIFFLTAICLFSAGIALATNSEKEDEHLFDYTFRDKNTDYAGDVKLDQLEKILEKEGLLEHFSSLVDVELAYTKTGLELSFSKMVDLFREGESTKEKSYFIHVFENLQGSYLISLSSYNEVRKAAGLDPIVLNDKEAVLYMPKEFMIDENLMQGIIGKKQEIQIAEETFQLLPEIENIPIVTDREITLAHALILPDEVFHASIDGEASSYISGILDPAFVEEKGLMQAIMQMNERLDQSPIAYESYLQNMGRKLIYLVSSSYISIYLASILLVVSNTLIAVFYLMGERKNQRNYQTLVHLGASYQDLCRSSSKQISWYFALPLAMAVIHSFFGIVSLFAGPLSFSSQERMVVQFQIALFVLLLLIIIEFIYIKLVKRSSHKYLWTLMEPKRVE